MAAGRSGVAAQAYDNLSGKRTYAECCSRRPDRSHGNGGEVVAAQYRLSAPVEVVSAREADPVSSACSAVPPAGRALMPLLAARGGRWHH